MKVVNYAAWIPSQGAQLEVADAPFPTDIADDEVVIKNKAVAVNPVDWKIQAAPQPIFDIKYPYILGSDVAGEVVGVGAAVRHLSKGDRVIGHALGFLSTDGRGMSGMERVLDARLTDPAKAGEPVALSMKVR